MTYQTMTLAELQAARAALVANGTGDAPISPGGPSALQECDAWIAQRQVEEAAS